MWSLFKKLGLHATLVYSASDYNESSKQGLLPCSSTCGTQTPNITEELFRKADFQAQPQRSWIRICILTRCPSDWFEKHCTSGLGMRRWTANPFLRRVSAPSLQVNSPPCPAGQLLSNLGGKKFEPWVPVLPLAKVTELLRVTSLYPKKQTNNFPGLLWELDAWVV